MEPNIFIAVDSEHVYSVTECVKIIKPLKEKIAGVKGNTTFIEPDNITLFKEFGIPVFYDMKFHDIPKVVFNHVKQILKFDVDYLTVMATGGIEMLKASYDAGGDKVIAVSILTSLNETDVSSIYGYGSSSIDEIISDKVLFLAELAFNAGIRNIVCSPLEISVLKHSGLDLTIFTPGIRPNWWMDKNKNSAGQTRYTSATEAIGLGADYLVIGSPIMKAANQSEALDMTLEEIGEYREQPHDRY